MTTLKFADTHNLVTFLEKPTESDGFEQIVDFLNAHTIQYALTVNSTIYISCIKQFWTTAKVKTVNGEVQLQALVDGKKIIITESTTKKPRKPKRKNTEVPQPGGSTEHVADEAVNEEMDDSLVRAATNASSLEAEQDSGLGSGPKRQDTMGDTIAQIRVLDLENTKTAQAQEITSLKLRVKKLEKKGGSRTHKLKRLYKGRYGDDLMFYTSVLDDEEVFTGQDMAKKEINVAEKKVSNANPVTTAGEVVTTASVKISTASPTKTIIADDLTLAQTLIEIRSAKPKVKKGL
ncbi:hypothetical protein Tco_0730933 [Tanacetum coccineum]